MSENPFLQYEKAEGQHLPVEAYTSDEWLEKERERIFGRCWQFAGMTDDLAQAGDYATLEAGRHRLFVIRTRDGALRAFHNLCRHRGTELLQGRGNAKDGIRCFYHHWTYSIDGALRGVPFKSEQFPGLDRAKNGLHPAAVATFKGMVFAHPDPDAVPMEQWLAGLGDAMGPVDPSKLVEVWTHSYAIEANWKVILENFADGFHVPFLHPATNGTLGKAADVVASYHGNHFTYFLPSASKAAGDDFGLPLLEGVDKSTRGLHIQWIFPNLGLTALPQVWFTFHVRPQSPTSSVVDVRSRVSPLAEALPDVEEKAQLAMGLAPTGADVHPLESKDFILEDIFACEALQRSMTSPAFGVGQLSYLEDALPMYQRTIAAYMEER